MLPVSILLLHNTIFSYSTYCAITENLHSPPQKKMEFPGNEGSCKTQKFLKTYEATFQFLEKLFRPLRLRQQEPPFGTQKYFRASPLLSFLNPLLHLKKICQTLVLLNIFTVIEQFQLADFEILLSQCHFIIKSLSISNF